MGLTKTRVSGEAVGGAAGDPRSPRLGQTGKKAGLSRDSYPSRTHYRLLLSPLTLRRGDTACRLAPAAVRAVLNGRASGGVTGRHAPSASESLPLRFLRQDSDR